jgi:hypothetical protein
MNVIRLCVWSLLPIGMAVAASGCGENTGLATVAVTGTVTQKGTPVEGAIVSFVPAGPGAVGAVGTTDAAGKFSLTTHSKDDGAVPGQYKVTVTKYEGAKAVEGTGQATATGDMPASYTGAAADAPPAKNLLPEKYASPDTSGLTGTVNSTPTTLNFDLEG